jgi:hypothetical protein
MLKAPPVYLVDGVAINGVSGGPVFDDRCHLVGLVSRLSAESDRTRHYIAWCFLGGTDQFHLCLDYRALEAKGSLCRFLTNWTRAFVALLNKPVSTSTVRWLSINPKGIIPAGGQDGLQGCRS